MSAVGHAWNEGAVVVTNGDDGRGGGFIVEGAGEGALKGGEGANVAARDDWYVERLERRVAEGRGEDVVKNRG